TTADKLPLCEGGATGLTWVCQVHSPLSAYGHASARSLLRGGRAPELLPGGGAARRHAARGEPPDPLAREAARPAARRPLGSAGRADGSRAAPLPERAAAAGARGTAARRARRGGRG